MRPTARIFQGKSNLNHSKIRVKNLYADRLHFNFPCENRLNYGVFIAPVS
jgi:hypothetical protein